MRHRRPVIELDFGFNLQYGYRDLARRITVREVYPKARRRRPAPVSEAVRKAVVDGYLAGWTMPALARVHGLTYSRVRNLLLRAGVELRPKGPAPRGVTS